MKAKLILCHISNKLVLHYISTCPDYVAFKIVMITSVTS